MASKSKKKSKGKKKLSNELRVKKVECRITADDKIRFRKLRDSLGTQYATLLRAALIEKYPEVFIDERDSLRD